MIDRSFAPVELLRSPFELLALLVAYFCICVEMELRGEDFGSIYGSIG